MPRRHFTMSRKGLARVRWGLIGLSLATLWRLRRRGDLPEPIRLSPGCVGWRSSDIEAWLSARVGRR